VQLQHGLGTADIAGAVAPAIGGASALFFFARATSRGTLPNDPRSKKRQLNSCRRATRTGRSGTMDSIIYLVGLIVIIMFILSFLGLR
jgi:hypothetical protein